MALFSKLVICGLCGKRHKSKKQRKRQFYCCSTYDNFGKDKCSRLPVEEELVVGLLEMRLSEEITKELIREKVEDIVVHTDKLIINIINEEPIIYSDKFLQISDLGQRQR